MVGRGSEESLTKQTSIDSTLCRSGRSQCHSKTLSARGMYVVGTRRPVPATLPVGQYSRNVLKSVLKHATFVLEMRTLAKEESRPAVELLFGAYRRRILSLLLLSPDDSLHVREIARLTNIPAGSLHRELRLLFQAGLLVRERSGNQVCYRAERQCPIFEDLAAIFRKTTGLADVLREALEPLAENIDVAFVFGSVAQGKERQVSDVDVLVVGAVSFASAVETLNRTHELLRRPVNPVVMTSEDFRRKYRSDDRFVGRVVREPKIYLIGGAHELGELVEDRSAQGTPAQRSGDRPAASSGGTELG